MAQPTSTQPTIELDERSAQLRRPDSDTAETRRAATYRPADAAGDLRELVAELRDTLRDEVERRDRLDADRTALLTGAAQCAESLGEYRAARDLLEPLVHESEADGPVRPALERTYRRILRQLRDDSGGLVDSLDAEADQAAGPELGLLRRAAAHEAWLHGAEPRDVLERLRAHEPHSEDGDFSVLWHAQLSADVLLETGELEAAKDRLERGLEAFRRRDAHDLVQTLSGRLAVWEHLTGHPERAALRLEDQVESGRVDGDLLELWVDARRECGQSAPAADLIDRLPTQHVFRSTWITIGIESDETSALEALGDALSADDLDRTALESAYFRWERDPEVLSTQDAARVLQRLATTAPEPARRAEWLVRLGELHEADRQRSEDAKAAYERALEAHPTCRAALRHLIRLARREADARRLAELLVHRLEHIDADETGTHLELARVFETELIRPKESLSHYRAVLDDCGWHLGALKGAVRQLRRLKEWRELADLLVEMCGRAPSDAEAARLLNEIAELAEGPLDDPELAADAYRRALSIPDVRRAEWAQMGRLFDRESRWEALRGLHHREIEGTERSGRRAELSTAAGRLAERIDAPEEARKDYRQALAEEPGHLEATQRLQRVLKTQGRWDAVAAVVEAQVEATQQPALARRRLAELADIVERQLDAPERALEIWAALSKRHPADTEILAQRTRLARRLGRWHDVCDLLEERASLEEGALRADLLGRLGLILEWTLECPDAACDAYFDALAAEPGNPQWLDGVARTWASSKNAPSDVADRLEDRLLDGMSGDVRDAYFKTMARLRERSETDVEASRGYRMHGDRESLENQIALRFAMASSGERAELAQARRTTVHHPLEQIAFARFAQPSEDTQRALDGLERRFTDPERRFLSGEFPPAVNFDIDEEHPDIRVASLLDRLVSDTDIPDYEATDVSLVEARIQARIARAKADFGAFVHWTGHELTARRCRSGFVERLLDAARVARDSDHREVAQRWHRTAALAACPNLDPERDEPTPQSLRGDVDHGLMDRLYDALASTKQWRLQAACLESNIEGTQTGPGRKLELFARLGETREEHLDDLQGAQRAFLACWDLGGRPEHLEHVVRLDRALGDREMALRHQRQHMDTLSEQGAAAHRLLQSGIRLADLLLADDADRAQGIELLEALDDEFADLRGHETVLRMLAYAYCDAQRYHDAVEAFQRVLKFKVTEEERGDWETLVALYDRQLDDPETAYGLQWRIVRSFPTSEAALDRLLDLADRAARLEDCLEQLESLASQRSSTERQTLLVRGGTLAARGLDRPSKAAELYDRCLASLSAEEGKNEASDGPTMTSVLRSKVQALAKTRGRYEETVETFRALIHREPLCADAHRVMAEVFEEQQAYDRARLAKQVLAALAGESHRQTRRAKAKPARKIDDEMVEAYLLPDRLDPGVFHALRQAMPLARKIFDDALPQGQVLDSQQVTTVCDEEARRQIDTSLEAFELGRTTIDCGDNGPPAPQIIGASRPRLWFQADQLREMTPAERRFAAGYAGALAWSGLAPLTNLDGRQMWHLIEGTWLRQTGDGFSERVDLESQQASEAVSSPFLTMARRRLMHAVEPVEDMMADVPCELWPDDVEAFAARTGLVLCGDIYAGIRCLLRFRGWGLGFDAPETRDRLHRTALVGRLVEFAFSDAYIEARYELGLGARG
jgi:tetratricopeptide (TPR) repeat protein